MNRSRREFITGAAAIGAFNLIPARVLWGATAPSNQLTRALIGYGGIARSMDIKGKFGNHMNPAEWGFPRIVGICDPDAQHLREGLADAEKYGYGKVKGCKDFRELLADPGIDIVHICSPPHWHGVTLTNHAEIAQILQNHQFIETPH